MIDTWLHIVPPALPFAYAVAWALYVWRFARGFTNRTWITFGPLTAAWLAHLAYLVAYGLYTGYHPMTTVYEFLSFVGMSIAAVYLALEWRFRTPFSGTFVLPVIIALQGIAAVGIEPSAPRAELLHQTRYELHAGTMALAYAALLLSALYSLMLLLFHRALLRRKFTLLFERLPSLDVLARIAHAALQIGWVLLTASAALGAAAALGHRQDLQTDWRIHLVPLVWAAYTAALAGKRFGRWPDRVVAWWNILAFAALLALTVAGNLVGSGWHSFLGTS